MQFFCLLKASTLKKKCFQLLAAYDMEIYILKNIKDQYLSFFFLYYQMIAIEKAKIV